MWEETINDIAAAHHVLDGLDDGCELLKQLALLLVVQYIELADVTQRVLLFKGREYDLVFTHRMGIVDAAHKQKATLQALQGELERSVRNGGVLAQYLQCSKPCAACLASSSSITWLNAM